ncbi:MAG: CGNR zinc finger domain-containing protein [Solirubrobacterales bacterium]
MNIAELTELVGDKPAPTPLLALQAFVNTLDVESGTDLLGSRAEFRDWLRDTELEAGRVAVGAEELRRARALRDTFRGLLAASAHGEVDRGAARRLRSEARARRIPLAVGPDGRLELDLSPPHSVDELLSLLIGIAFQAQLDGRWERLKLCRNDECQWAFFDSSRNRGGTWCEMKVCGNRIKNRRYRRRHQAHS